MAKGQGISGITSSAAIKKIARILCCDNRQKVPQASARSQEKSVCWAWFCLTWEQLVWNGNISYAGELVTVCKQFCRHCLLQLQNNELPGGVIVTLLLLCFIEYVLLVLLLCFLVTLSKRHLIAIGLLTESSAGCNNSVEQLDFPLVQADSKYPWASHLSHSM